MLETLVLPLQRKDTLEQAGPASNDIYQDLTMRTAAVKHRPSRIVLVPQHINCPLVLHQFSQNASTA